MDKLLPKSRWQQFFLVVLVISAILSVFFADRMSLDTPQPAPLSGELLEMRKSPSQWTRT
jgi:hypothetical protein